MCCWELRVELDYTSFFLFTFIRHVFFAEREERTAVAALAAADSEPKQLIGDQVTLPFNQFSLPDCRQGECSLCVYVKNKN